VFDAYDIDDKEYYGLQELRELTEFLGMPMVEVDITGIYIDPGDDGLRAWAGGKYRESGRAREGLVFRPESPMRVSGDRVSFKVINLEYKEG
jgi:hypothetical protein